MEWTAFVKSENVAKAEMAIKNDFEVAAKQSLTVRGAKSLGIEEDGSFFVFSGTDEGIARCKELLKDFVSEASEENLKKATDKVKAEGEAAAQGMGSIFR